MAASCNEEFPILAPSPWLVRHAGRISPAGEVLDLACGRGRHAIHLAGLGHRVCAVDRDATALAGLAGVAGVETLCCDLEGEVWPLAGRRYAGLVVANYLWRPRLPDTLALLAPGGVLIYETFMQGNAAYGKPSRPEFLLAPGELLVVARSAGLRVVDFVEGYEAAPRPAMRQAICAVRD